ncbi:MAG TPA: ABC transporter substrate-binding protein [Thermomicrobiales bacterium]
MRGHSPNLMTRRVSRRAVLGALSAAVVGAAAACQNDDPNSSSSTPTPSPTPEPTLTPTQGVVASPVPGYADPTKWSGRALTIAVWGGPYEEAQRAAFFDPFSEATGATIQTQTAEIGVLREQVDAGEVIWDVLTLPMEEVLVLAREGYLQPIDYKVVDRSALYDDITLQYGVGVAYSSTVMLYPAGTTRAPQSWADFWDVTPPEPGVDLEPEQARVLRRSPVGTLEFALLADGVPMEELYPLDVERAFASLDRIRRNVIVWWEESKEPIELVSSGLAAMASGWNVRLQQFDIHDAVRIQWFGGMLTADAWVVPKGAPNADVAMDFINFATRAVPTANFSRLLPYGPVNRDAFNLLREDRKAILPSAPQNKAVQFTQNWNYWVDNREALSERFENWLLSEEPETTPSSGEPR